MKKLLLLFAMAAVLFACQKDKDPVATEQEVSFSATNVTPNLKGSEDWPCKANIPDHAWIQINGVNYYPELFTLDGKLYTQAIKLPIGVYNVQEFVLYDDVDGVLGITDGDVLVFGTPHVGSAYAVYTTPDVPFEFTVQAFKKIEIDIQVLCFQDAVYDKFGFFWFDITEIVIREFCFFGDVCLNGMPWDPDDYAGSWYALNGLEEDEIAFFHVKVFKNGVEVPYSPFKNYTPNGDYIPGPVCAEFPDNLSITGEVFTFELWVLVRNQVGAFVFQFYDTYTAIDNGPLTKGIPPVPAVGAEGIADFAIGTCSPMSTNIYAWLPAPPPPPPIVTTGYTPYDESTGAVRFRSFANTGADEIYLGIPDLGVAGNRVQSQFTWASTHTFSFTYDPLMDKLVATVNSTTLEYPNFSAQLVAKGKTYGAAMANVMQITVAARDVGTTVALNNVMLDSYSLGNFTATYNQYNDWMVTGFDFGNGFTISGTLDKSGTFSLSQETSRVDIRFGYDAP